MENYIAGVAQAARFLGCGKRTIFRLIKDGKFPEPEKFIDSAAGRLRLWRSETLQSFKIQPRGKPVKMA